MRVKRCARFASGSPPEPLAAAARRARRASLLGRVVCLGFALGCHTPEATPSAGATSGAGGGAVAPGAAVSGAAAASAAASGVPVSSTVVSSAALSPAAASPAGASPAGAPGAAPDPRQLFEFERPCMGTRCTIVVYHQDRGRVENAVIRAVAEIDRLDALMTTWTDGSEVSRINAAAGTGEWVAVSPETFEVLERSAWVGRETGGAFDVTVGAFKGLWKFDEDNDGSLPRRADVLARLPLVDYRGLVLDAGRRTARLARPGQSITLGGIAKGLIVDRAVAKLKEAGLSDFLVQAGGDMYAAGRRGDRAWRVGIQDPRAGTGPRSTDSSFALLALENSAFNTSGDYERFIIRDGKRYHHILDPRTGYPVSGTRSVTVLAPTSFLADTLDTAIFVLGPERGLALCAETPGVEAVIVDASNRVHVSPGLKDRIEILRPPTDAP